MRKRPNYSAQIIGFSIAEGVAINLIALGWWKTAAICVLFGFLATTRWLRAEILDKVDPEPTEPAPPAR